jgi:hypothetical protein
MDRIWLVSRSKLAGNERNAKGMLMEKKKGCQQIY